MKGRRAVALGMLVMMWAAGLAAWPVGSGPSPARAAGPVIQLSPVLSGFSNPLFVTNAHDGTKRLFIVEQGGLIKLLKPGSSTPTVFLDLSGTVLSGGERGLLGLTFHPDYASNGRFFVNYTRRPDGATVVAEYHVSAADDDVADTTGSPILTIAQPFDNHNGGMIEFGPDGFLYIGMGDGGSSNDPDERGQNINDLLGKILRIDVDHPSAPLPYSSPSDNPFFGVTDARDEIYATGFRNPWRYSFDRGTGALYVGDVGQDDIEEIDIVTLGGNYGWSIWEGDRCTHNNGATGPCSSTGFTFPITEYDHSGGRCSVTGGYVYRGTKGSLPVGTYVFGDLCTGEIFTLLNGTSNVALDTGFQLASFGEDEAGEIYVVDRRGGAVYRIGVGGCSIGLGASSASIGAFGSVFSTVAVSAGSGCAWSAVSSAPWLRVARGTGAGDGVVVFTVDNNGASASPRTGTLDIGGQTFTVTQAGAACTARVAPIVKVYGPPGGAGSASVSIPAGCGWAATSTVSWINVTAGSGTGNGQVQFTVDANPGALRVGSITVAGRAITVIAF